MPFNYSETTAAARRRLAEMEQRIAELEAQEKDHRRRTEEAHEGSHMHGILFSEAADAIFLVGPTGQILILFRDCQLLYSRGTQRRFRYVITSSG